MNLFKRTIISLLLVGLILPTTSLAFSVPAPADVGAPEVEVSIPQIIANITNWVFTFLGILAVLMILFAGLMYMTSAGDDQRMTAARKILIYAVVGLVISVLAVVIVRNVVGAMTNSGGGNGWHLRVGGDNWGVNVGSDGVGVRVNNP